MKPLSAFREGPYGYMRAPSQGRVLTKPLCTIPKQNHIATLYWIRTRQGGQGSQLNREQKKPFSFIVLPLVLRLL